MMNLKINHLVYYLTTDSQHLIDIVQGEIQFLLRLFQWSVTMIVSWTRSTEILMDKTSVF